MGQDPYAGAIPDAPAAPSGPDLYAGAEPLHPSEISHDQRNELLQERIRSGASAADVLNYAQTLGLRITSHLDDNIGNQNAHVINDPQRDSAAPIEHGPGLLNAVARRLNAGGRELANGVTAGFGDKIAAAADAIIPLDALAGGDVHSIWDGSSFGDAYHHNLAQQQGATEAADNAYPVQSVGMNALGALVSPVTKGAEAVAGLKAGAGLGSRAIRALAPDAVYGATYGAGSSNADTVGGVARDAAIGGAGGLAGSAVGQGVARVGGRIVGGIVNPAARLLRDSGASTTIGQTIGGMANRMEGKLSSVPIVGDMIAARRAEAGATLINAPLNRALAPIKEKLPPDVAGSEALQYAQDAFDKVYARARAGMSLTLDRQLKSDLSRITIQAQGRGSASLSTEYAKRFKGIIQEDVLRRLQHGSLNGDELSTVVSDLKRKAAKYAAGNNSADAQEFGDAIKGLVDVLDRAATRNPGTTAEARSLKRQADRGYRYLVLAQNAAKRRGGEAGTVTAAQLDAAVQGMDRTARNNAYSRNNAFGQDISNAGKEVMPNVPNSFSADRYLMARGGAALVSGGGAEELNRHGHPYLAAPLAVGALGSLAYTRGGNALISRSLIDRPQAFRRAGPQVENALRPYLGSVGAVAGVRSTKRR